MGRYYRYYRWRHSYNSKKVREEQNRLQEELRKKNEKDEQVEEEDAESDNVEKDESSNYRYYRNAEELLSQFAEIKEDRDKKSTEEKQENAKNHEKKSKSKAKRSREEFEEDQRDDYLNMPELNSRTWPKYIGSIQFRSKVQLEYFGEMKRIEFTMLKRWANKKAEELHRGDPLLVDFRPIDESRGKSKTLNLQFGVFEHTGCEIWNFLGYKDFVTLKLFCMNPSSFQTQIDGNKAFDVIMDVYLNKAFVANPLTLANFLIDETQGQPDKKEEEENEEEDIETKDSIQKNKKNKTNKKKNDKGRQIKEESSSDEKSDRDIEEAIMEKEEQPKGKKTTKKPKLTKNELIVEWEFNYILHMKEAIPQLFDLMKLKRTIPSLLSKKKGTEGNLLKNLALTRQHATLPAKLALKSEEMRDYYSHCPEALENATPLFFLKEKEEQIKEKKPQKLLRTSARRAKNKEENKNKFIEEEEDQELDKFKGNNYGNLNQNTRESLGLVEDEGKEKEELTDEEAQKLNEKFSNMHESQFYSMTPAPKTMITKLFDYQEQGLSWMMYREGRLSKKELFKNFPQHFIEDRELNPFYEEITLPDSTKLYHNVFSAEISQSFVHARHTFGGILADQMGLGKTIMSLALIHSDLKKSKTRSMISGTLLVLPLTCLGQWEGEIRKHSNKDSIKILNYHDKESRKVDNLNEYDVVICPYHLLGSEYSENPQGTLFKKKWHRVILDEAQKIKNSKSTIAKAAFQLDAEFRWALTGTPIENKLDDLFSLLKFLKVETFGEWFWWNSYINQNASRSDKFDLLHQILKPLTLRRTKLSKDNEGKQILELPSKNIHLELVKLTASEQKLYNLLLKGSRNIVEEIQGKSNNSGLGNNYMHVFQMICKLRQFCVHPSLVFKDIDVSKVSNIALLKKKVDAFLDKFRVAGSKQNDANLSQQSQHEEDGSKISNEYRNELIQNIKQGDFKNCLVCFDDIAVHSLSICGHILCKPCFTQSIQVHKTCPICRHPLKLEDICDIAIPEEEDEESEQKEMDFNDINKLSGSKVKRIVEIIQDIHTKGEKVVVFTQWIALINILDVHLRSRDILFERIEGKIKAGDKDKALKRFEKQVVNSKKEANITVLLASMKSASVGLNLVAANHVILCDPWWNPAVEDQAMERVHRIGQKKEVEVWRIICASTIEEKVLELHKQKREMIDNALACTDSERRSGALSELQFLLN